MNLEEKASQSEFIVRQYYTVSIDEGRIDTHRTEFPSGDQAVELYFQRMHRLLHGLLADKKSLAAVLEYQVLLEHTVTHGDGRGDYFEDHYGGAAISLPGLLARLSCFSQDDIAWLEKVAERLKQPRGEEDYGDPDMLEVFADAFKVIPSGWNIGPHVHANYASHA